MERSLIHLKNAKGGKERVVFIHPDLKNALMVLQEATLPGRAGSAGTFIRKDEFIPRIIS